MDISIDERTSCYNFYFHCSRGSDRFLFGFQEIGPKSPANNRMRTIRELCDVVQTRRLEEVRMLKISFFNYTC